MKCRPPNADHNTTQGSKKDKAALQVLHDLRGSQLFALARTSNLHALHAKQKERKIEKKREKES